jgi:TP901 family phage tail tape measure protein
MQKNALKGCEKMDLGVIKTSFVLDIRSFTDNMKLIEDRLHSAAKSMALITGDKEFGSLGNNIDKVEDKLTGTQKSLMNFSKMGKKFQDMGSDLTKYLTLPIVGMGAVGTKTAADFEEGLSKIKAVTGASGEEMKKMHDLAIEMGAKTSFSAKEAASGIEELAKAGLSTSQILNGGLSGALSLAAAGDLDLADAAEVASNVLNSFKKDSLSVAQAADILAGGANASATSVGELKFGLSQVAAVASGVGMSFNDTTTALSLFANNGIKGSDAGTSLKTMLMNLQPQTKAQKAMFDQLGLSMADGSSKFYDAQGHLKSLSEISGLLQSSMGGLTDAQRLSTMETLFGADAIRAANVLYKEGTKGVTDMNAAMSKVTAEDTAKTKLDNFKGSLEQLKGSLETAGIVIGEMVLPTLRGFVDGITNLTNKFMELSPTSQKIILIILGLVASIGPLLLIVGKTITTIAAIKTAFMTLGLTTQIVGGMMRGALIASGIGALLIGIGVAIWLIVKHWDKVKETTLKVWGIVSSYLSKKFKELSDYTSKIFGGIADFFSNTWNSIKDYTSQKFNEISSSIQNIFTGIVDKIKGFGQLIFNAVSNAWLRVSNTTSSIFAGIKNFFAYWWPTLLIVFTGPLGFLIVYIVQHWNSIRDNTVSIFNIIKNYISAAFGFILNTIQTIVKSIADKVGTGFKLVSDIVTSITTSIKNTAVSIWTSISNTVSNLISGLVRMVSPIFNSLRSFISNTWSGISSSASNILTGMRNTIVNIASGIKNSVSGIWTSIKDNALNTFYGLFNKVGEIFGRIRDAIVTPFRNIKFPRPDVKFGSTTKSFMGVSFPVPTMDVKWYAKGGIFSSPSVIGVGEAGDEAVLPIRKLSGILADTLNKMDVDTSGGKGSNTVINFNGNYNFNDKNDIDYFMNQAALLTKRRK